MRPVIALVDHFDIVGVDARAADRLGEHFGVGKLAHVVPDVDDAKPRRLGVERRVVLHLADDEAVDVVAQARDDGVAA